MTIETAEAYLDQIERAQRYTLKLARKSGLVEGFVWRAPPSSQRGPRRLLSHRAPPLPFHSFKHLGAGHCRVCGQPTDGRLTWHANCVTTYTLMTKATTYATAIVARQGQKCAITGDPIPLEPYFTGCEIDHKVPLYRVARDHADEPWYRLLRFWTLDNLQAITRAAHIAKCAAEARERAGMREKTDQQGALL